MTTFYNEAAEIQKALREFKSYALKEDIWPKRLGVRTPTWRIKTKSGNIIWIYLTQDSHMAFRLNLEEVTRALTGEAAKHDKRRWVYSSASDTPVSKPTKKDPPPKLKSV